MNTMAFTTEEMRAIHVGGPGHLHVRFPEPVASEMAVLLARLDRTPAGVPFALGYTASGASEAAILGVICSVALGWLAHIPEAAGWRLALERLLASGLTTQAEIRELLAQGAPEPVVAAAVARVLAGTI